MQAIYLQISQPSVLSNKIIGYDANRSSTLNYTNFSQIISHETGHDYAWFATKSTADRKPTKGNSYKK